MEEDKIQKLHDTLSKLRKGKGLGTTSHFNFGGGHTKNNNGIPFKERKDGTLYRDDGLPMNALYSNFVKEGLYSQQDSALKYGDGRVIKRNFDDCTNVEDVDDETKEVNDNEKNQRKSNDSSLVKKRKKEEKKKLKKEKKLEEKKKAKLEEKKRKKLEEKKQAKLEAKRKAKEEMQRKHSLNTKESPSEKNKKEFTSNNDGGDSKGKKKSKKKSKKKEERRS